MNFNPRAPCGARQVCAPSALTRRTNFNPRAPCGARHVFSRRGVVISAISIHAPRAGRDAAEGGRAGWITNFNPRAPCGARQVTDVEVESIAKFQSTRPVRGATPHPPRPRRPHQISIHAPRAGRDLLDLAGYLTFRISIHAPRAGRDGRDRGVSSAQAYFNPRAPCGARPTSTPWPSSWRNFNPRAPCGARPAATKKSAGAFKFQSTRPVRGATRRSTPSPRPSRDFNPRAPCGARPFLDQTGLELGVISIHAPRAGRDCSCP